MAVALSPPPPQPYRIADHFGDITHDTNDRHPKRSDHFVASVQIFAEQTQSLPGSPTIDRNAHE
jgi:hypothetical protein